MAVALDVGFETPSSFSRAFRQITGEAPSAYAKRWRAAGAPPVPACFALMYTRPLGLSSSGQAERGEPG
jgi:AraC-like DNA-binding protein